MAALLHVFVSEVVPSTIDRNITQIVHRLLVRET